MSGYDKHVNGLSVRLKRIDNADNLKIELRGATEGRIAETYIYRYNVDNTKHDYVTWDFGDTITLVAGRRYSVVLLSSYDPESTYCYEIYTLQDGYPYGFTCPILFSDGHAQFYRDGAWHNWETWNENRRDQDLQMYFHKK